MLGSAWRVFSRLSVLHPCSTVRLLGLDCSVSSGTAASHGLETTWESLPLTGFGLDFPHSALQRDPFFCVSLCFELCKF